MVDALTTQDGKDITEALKAISLQLSGISNVNSRQISAGDTRVPYLENTFTLAAGERREVFQVYNYFRVLALTGGSLSVRFGQNGVETPFTSAGVGAKFEDIFSRLTLVNTHVTDSMTLTIAIALGSINDDRLNVSGSVVVSSITNPVTITGVISGITQIDQSNDFATSQTVVSNAAVQLVVAAAANGNITIKAGVSDLYIAKTNAVTTANGFLIEANTSFTFATVTDIYGIRSAAGTDKAYVLKESY